MDHVDPVPTPRRPGGTNGDQGENPPEVSVVTPAEDIRTIAINNIAWGAVLAGVALSLIVHLGTATAQDARNVSIGAGVWWAVSGIIAAFAGGVTAGRLSGKPDQSTASRTVTAILGAIALALGAMAARFGGRYGAIDSTITPLARFREAVPPAMRDRLH